jgi:hypothetical protein
VVGEVVEKQRVANHKRSLGEAQRTTAKWPRRDRR